MSDPQPNPFSPSKSDTAIRLESEEHSFCVLNIGIWVVYVEDSGCAVCDERSEVEILG
jgi:hypothetical protein